MNDLLQVEESTGRTPPELANAPDLWPEHRAAWEAWRYLHAGRTGDFASIALTEIEAYARLKGLDAARLAEQVRTIDEKFLELRQKDK